MSDDDLIAAGWKLRRGDGFMASIGSLWSRREGAGFAYAVRAGQQHANALGVIHGGLLCTLLDHAMLVNAWDSAGRRPCVTVSLDVRFVAAASPGDLLIARGLLDEQGRTLVFASGTVSAVRDAATEGGAGASCSEAVVARGSAVIRVRSAPEG